MKRNILFLPAYDKTDPDPKKHYGVDCLEMRFLLGDNHKYVEFQLLTQWYLPHTMDRRFSALKNDILTGKPEFLVRHFNEPYPADLCYYSSERLSEDDTLFESVKTLGGQPYFYGYKYRDEDGNIAKDVAFQLLVSGGDDALWKYLEDYYKEVFGAE